MSFPGAFREEAGDYPDEETARAAFWEVYPKNLLASHCR